MSLPNFNKPFNEVSTFGDMSHFEDVHFLGRVEVTHP